MPNSKAKPRGRPPTGRTPDKERSAKSLENLKAAGGHRLNCNLSPQAAADLMAIMGREELNQRQAVEAALYAYANL